MSASRRLVLRHSLELSSRSTRAIAGASLAAALGELRKIEAEKPPSTEAEQGAHDRRRADLFGALEGLIRQKPGTVAALSRLVLRRDPISTVLTDALGASGSAAAQRALTELLEQRRNLSGPWSKDAAIALSMTPAPSQDTVAELKSLLSDPVLGTQAMYGLGTSARHLREGGHAAEANEIVALIMSRLRAAATPVQQVVALRAVANAGDGAAYPVVEPLLTAKNDDVRTAAVESLQLMRGGHRDSGAPRPGSSCASRRAPRPHEMAPGFPARGRHGERSRGRGPGGRDPALSAYSIDLPGRLTHRTASAIGM